LEKDNFIVSLERLFEKDDIDWSKKTKELSLSWQQIKEMSKDPLVTIGGHTVNHLALNQLAENEIYDEVIEANRLIEDKINRKIEHFAYPFGSNYEINERECDIVKTLGFKTATTTRKGAIFPEHANHLWCLPRFELNENFNIKEVGKMRKKKIVTV
jgi:peptidoglycan/xylan/chitin deacetylase (PgdA/CDA1 family)